MVQKLLEVRDIRVWYSGVEALKGISIEVEVGAVVCLIGANGAGKTTTLKAISGIKVPLSGEIYFEGKRIDDLPAHKVARIEIIHVPEGGKLFPDMSVRENLEMGAFTKWDPKFIKRGIEEILELFPALKDRLKQSAGTLSGGERQMVAIGRGLMSRPRLLLMDEPTLGLSPILCESIANWIVKINQRGVSILLAEQNAIMALRISQKGYVLETGRIALQGYPQDLLTNEQVRKSYLGI